MPVPDKVRLAAEEAEAREAALREGKTSQAPTQQQPTQPAREEPAELPTPAPAEPLTLGNPSSQNRPADDAWEQKYKVLKGKYDKEVPSLAHQVKQQQEQIDALMARASEAEKASRAAAEKEQYSDLNAMLKAAEEDLDPESMAKALKRLSDLVISQERVISDLTEQQSRVSHTQEETQSQLVDRLIEDVQKAVGRALGPINSSDDFTSWVQEVDSDLMSRYGIRKTRQDILDEVLDTVTPANFEQKVQVAANVYKAFLGERGKHERQLDEQLTPSPAHEGARTERPASIQWTKSMVDDFYRPKPRDERFQNLSPEKREALEKDINRAPAEGRFDPYR